MDAYDYFVMRSLWRYDASMDWGRVRRVLGEAFFPATTISDWVQLLAFAAVAFGGAAVFGWLTGLIPAIVWAAIGLVVLFCSASYRLLGRLDETVAKAPQLVLSDPMTYPDEMTPLTRCPIHLWRIRVINAQPQTAATNVVVKVTRTDPNIPLPAFEVHKTHTDYPFTPVSARFNEPLDYDLVAKRKDHYHLFFFRSDLGPNRSYEYQLSDTELDKVQNALYKGEGFKVTVAVYADPPAAVPEPRSYVFRADPDKDKGLMYVSSPPS
ncbi:MAG: hypothetical protein Q7T33_04875 [Dehalococcoidia bacterium]|nr:hypothetical protein [Dehalococcoidia bacterium]